MKVGVSPDRFWSMTPVEFWWLLEEEEYMDKEEFEMLKEKFKDKINA